MPSASLVSIGLAALPAATTRTQAPASSATGGNVATAGTGKSTQSQNPSFILLWNQNLVAEREKL